MRFPFASASVCAARRRLLQRSGGGETEGVHRFCLLTSFFVSFFFLPRRVDALTVSVHQVRYSHRRITRRANTCKVARKRVLCVFHTVYFRDLDALQSRTP